MSTQVLRLARKTTNSLESTLEGILLNEITLSNMDYTEEKKWSRWRNDDTVILWCGKVSECINLTALDNQIKSLSKVLNFSSYHIDKVITNNRVLMTISIISPNKKELTYIHDRYYTEISKLVNITPIVSKNIVLSEINYYEFEPKLVLSF